MKTGTWKIVKGAVYAISGLALALLAVLGLGGYVYYMVIWMHAPLDKVLMVGVPFAIVLLVGAQASAVAAGNAFRKGT